MPEPDHPEPASRGGRATALWVSAVVLAAGATAVLVLSDDARLLRLGLVAALWAALVAAFAVAKLRNQMADDDEHIEDMQRIYELELEREIAARREFELEAENDARQRVAEETENEVEALRAELRTLRESLEQIVGGDIFFERVALRAESTRVRSLPDPHGQDNRVIDAQQGRALPSGGAHPGGTELIGRPSGGQHNPPTHPPRPVPPPPQARPPRTAPRPQYVRPVGHTPPVERPKPAQPEPPAPQTHEPAQPEPVPAPAAVPERQARSATTSKPPAGSHTEGTSVTELLAAYGSKGEPRKHRRRRE